MNTMFRDLPRVVPWTSWEEWKQVSVWLWSDDADQQILGLKRVDSWKCRGKIPVSVELTSNFISILLKDRKPSQQAISSVSNSNGNMLSENEKRMMYSMALIRFINGLVAPLQKSSQAQSIGSICRRIGIPYGLIDIRHEASHAEFPSIEKLRWACLECLQWLHLRYWTRQSSHFDQVRANVSSDLETIRSLQKFLTKDGAHKLNGYKEKKGQLKSILKKMNSSLSANQVLTCLIPALVDLPLLVPNKKTQLDKSYDEVPGRLILMWLEILKSFVAKWPNFFLPSLLVALINKLFKTANEIHQENNNSISRREIVYDEKAKSIKFKMNLYRLWYEHLVRLYYLQNTQMSKIEEITSNQNAQKQESTNLDQQHKTSEDENNDDKTQEDTIDDDNDAKEGKQTLSKRQKIHENRQKKLLQQKIDSERASTIANLDIPELPHKTILHLCFHNMNKQAVKVIKFTLCFVDSNERVKILPKIQQLFHFSSRALNLSRVHDAHEKGLPLERINELQIRAETNSDFVQPEQTRVMELEDFARLLKEKIDHPIGSTATQTGPANVESRFSTISQKKKKNNISIEKIQSLVTKKNTVGMWTICSDVSPGIGLNPSGNATDDLSLPIQLDSYKGALFLVPIPKKDVNNQLKQEEIDADTQMEYDDQNIDMLSDDQDDAIVEEMEIEQDNQETKESTTYSDQSSNSKSDIEEPKSKKRFTKADEQQKQQEHQVSIPSEMPKSSPKISDVSEIKAKVQLIIKPILKKK